jgi:hypothetical protein
VCVARLVLPDVTRWFLDKAHNKTRMLIINQGGNYGISS